MKRRDGIRVLKIGSFCGISTLAWGRALERVGVRDYMIYCADRWCRAGSSPGFRPVVHPGDRPGSTAAFQAIGERGIAHPTMGSGFARAACDPPTADISVVIPVYNHDRFIGQAIESVLSQTVRPREILCIDDGSTDRSAQAVEAVVARQPSVRFWSRPNQGAARTINEGIRAARGRYLAILNSDDLYDPARLLRCLAVLESHPDAAVVATDVSFLNAHGDAIRFPWYEEVYAFYEEIGDLGLGLANGNFLMTTSNIVARRAVFDEVGGFDDLRYTHDLDFFLRLLVHGDRLVHLREPLLTYRVHGGNTVSQDLAQVRLETAVVAAFFARRLASVNGAAAREPQYLSRLLKVIDRQQLTRLVALALLHAQREGAGVLSPAACLSDPAFRSQASSEIAAVELAKPAEPSPTRGSPNSVSDDLPPSYHQHKTANPPTLQRLIDRILRGSLPRRFFASVRWRSGLDAELEELRSRLEQLAGTLDAGRGHAVAGEARLDHELHEVISALRGRLTTFESALNELLARLAEFESRLASVETRRAYTDRAARGG